MVEVVIELTLNFLDYYGIIPEVVSENCLELLVYLWYFIE